MRTDPHDVCHACSAGQWQCDACEAWNDPGEDCACGEPNDERAPVEPLSRFRD